MTEQLHRKLCPSTTISAQPEIPGYKFRCRPRRVDMDPFYSPGLAMRAQIEKCNTFRSRACAATLPEQRAGRETKDNLQRSPALAGITPPMTIHRAKHAYP